MELMHLMERIRPIMLLKSWDYCVLWKLSEDQRFLEWICCCCGGAEKDMHGCEQEIFLPDSSTSTCRDVMFQHPRTTACDLLAQVPPSLALDCGGIYAQALLSNQAKWMNFVPFSESNMSNEIIGTRALFPSPLGLLELFSTQQLPEDEKVREFVAAQCNIYLEQQAMMNSSLSNGVQENTSKPFQLEGDDDNINDSQNHYQQTVSAAAVTSRDNSDHLSYDFPLKRKQLDTCSMNFLAQLSSYSTPEVDNNTGGSVVFDQNTSDVTHFSNSTEMDAYLQKQISSSTTQAGVLDDECGKHDNGRSNSGSDSDQNEEEDDPKYRRRNGKGPQSKNLMAERKRRKKLNERLYALRALVPKISKLDRASILGDAIEYVMELEKQVKDLQLELEEHSDDEGGRNNQDQVHPDVLSHKGNKNRPKSEKGKLSNGSNKELSINSNDGNDPSRKNQEVEENDKLQQMEPQVEVAQLDGNEFFVKVFREHKTGGFVRILEALNSLGLEVTNVNATRHTCLVSSIFKVEKRDNEMVQADHVRDTLLELTRNPSRGWSDQMSKASSDNNAADGNTDFLHNHHHHHLDNNHHKQANSHHFHRHRHH